jgi:MFS family permease
MKPVVMSSTLTGLCAVGLLARVSYSLARTPVLPLFAASFGIGAEAIGFAVAISTVTGIFFKLPAGVLSDVIGRMRTLFLGLAVFAVVPFAYLWVNSYETLVVVRFFHGFATAIYGPVAMAVVVEVAGNKRGEMLSWFSFVTIIGNLVGAPLGGLLLTLLSDEAPPQLTHFHMIYGVVAACGMAALLVALWVLRTEVRVQEKADGQTLRQVFDKFRTAISEILTDRRVFLTSNMEGVQNLAVGALDSVPSHLCGCDLQLYRISSRTLVGNPDSGRDCDEAGDGSDFRSAGAGPFALLGNVRLRDPICPDSLVSRLLDPHGLSRLFRAGRGNGHFICGSPGGRFLQGGAAGLGDGSLWYPL